MFAPIALRTATRVGSRRQMSTAAAPKLHKWKESSEAALNRPPPGHEHVRKL